MSPRTAYLLLLAVAAAGCSKPDELPSGNAVTTDVPRPSVNQPGVTPMAERIAVIGLLNKRNGIVRDLTLKPGQAVRVKDIIVRLRACEATAPWEHEKLTGAFIQVDSQRIDKQWARVFSGWLYKESPSLNVVEHPVYDVWPKSCAMTYPPGPSAPAAPVASNNRSSAPKSGGARAGDSAPSATAPTGPAAPEPPPSAVANNVT